MLGFDRFDHDDAGIVFRDLITLACAASSSASC